MPLKKLFSALLGRKQEEPVLELGTLNWSDAIARLADALPDALSWEWDERLRSVLAAFDASGQEQILSVLNAQLNEHWDHASIRKAPDNVKNAGKHYGGLQPTQMLFARRLTQDLILLGLWWPWGNGATISIRFAIYSSGPTTEEEDTIRAALKEMFDL